MSNAGGFGLIFLLLITSISVILYLRKNDNSYSVFITTIAPAVATVGFGTMFFVVLANFNKLIGDEGLWYLVFIIPGIILACGVAGYIRGEFLRYRRPHIYRNIGSGHAPTLDRGEDLGDADGIDEKVSSRA